MQNEIEELRKMIQALTEEVAKLRNTTSNTYRMVETLHRNDRFRKTQPTIIQNRFFPH